MKNENMEAYWQKFSVIKARNTDKIIAEFRIYKSNKFLNSDLYSLSFIL